MNNPLAPWFDALSGAADVVLRWLWQWPGWVWLVSGCVLAMALLVGRRLSRIGYLERSLWVSPLRGLGWLVLLTAAASVLVAMLTIAYVVLATFLNPPQASAVSYLQDVIAAFWPGRLQWLVVGLLGGVLLGALAWWWMARHLEPWLNRVSSSGTRMSGRVDGLTDIRTVAASLPKAKSFDPSKHFRAGEVFLGRDTAGKPVAIPLTLWRSTHAEFIGPSGTGKTSAVGVALVQSILAGDAVYVIDPKHDEWLPSVLHAACEDAGKPFHVLNLRPDQPPQFNLIDKVTPTELAELLVAGFALGDSGGEADHYRRRDRRIARRVSRLAEGNLLSIPELYAKAQATFPDLEDDAEGFDLHLEELSSLPCLSTREGVALRAALDDGGCVYIIGHTRDAAVLKAQRMVLIRLLQLLESRDRMKVQRHATIFLDEFKYMLSAPAVNALGTVRDRGCNLILAHQSLGDLEDCGEDLRPEAVRTSILDNTQLKWCYRNKDEATAEWIADMTGRIVIDTERRFVARNELLSETVEAKRMLDQQERHLIDTNMIKALPDRCAVVIGAGEARLAFVSPYPVKKRELTPIAATPLPVEDLPKEPADLIDVSDQSALAQPAEALI